MKKLYNVLGMALLFAAPSLGFAQTYCTPSSSCTSGDQIVNCFTQNGITNFSNLNTGCSPGAYNYLSTMTVSQFPGSSFDLTMQAGPTWGQGFMVWIDYNNNGSFLDAGEQVYTSPTTGVSPYTTTITIPAMTAPGVKRMRVRCNYAGWPSDPCNVQTFGETEDYNVDVVPQFADDAGVLSIDSPSMPACILGQNVYATIANGGTATLTSVTVNWSVNGFAQTPLNFTGSIASYQSQQVMLGTYGFSTGDVLKVWTSMPNGVSDQYAANDTITIILGTAMYGIYSIGGIGADYPTFNTAITDLINFGVCDSVIFEVANGTYTERLDIPEILGTSATAPVIFRSVTGNNTQVTLEESGSTTSNNYIVRFNGADFISFEDMTIRNNGTTYSRVLFFENGSNNNTFSNDRILGYVGTTTSANAYLIQGTGLNHNNTFTGNRIVGGSYGFYWWGTSTAARSQALTVENNEMDSMYYRAFYTYYTTGIAFNNNVVNMPIGGSGSSMAYVYYDNGGYQINNNRFNGRHTGTGINYMIYLYYGEATANNRGSITNNYMVSGDVGQNMYHYGFYSYYSNNYDFMHNSMNLLGTSTSTTYPMYIYYGGGMRIVNNSVVNMTSGGYAGPYWIQSFILEMDNNNYYGPNTPNFGYYNGAITNLSNWQSGTGFDQNSFDVNPNYQSRTELRPCNDTLDSKGKPMGIMVDLEGDARSSSVPDIGADEFIAGLPDLGPDTAVCAGIPLTLSMSGPSGSTYNWNTTETTPEITVTFPSTYFVEVTAHCGIVGYDTIVVTHIDNPIANFTSNTSYLGATFTNQSLSGTSYVWDFGDGTTSTEEHPHHVFANSGSHNVTLYVTNECGTDSITIQIILSVPGFMEHGDGVQASIFPNPGNGDMMVVMNGMSGSVQVSVIDLEGRILHTEQHQLNGSEYSTRMDMRAGLAQGIYLVRIDSMEGSVVQKLIVQ